MDAITHNTLVEDGWTYVAREDVPFSMSERRLYEKPGEGIIVLRVNGRDVISWHKYTAKERKHAFNHLKHGSAIS